MLRQKRPYYSFFRRSRMQVLAIIFTLWYNAQETEQIKTLRVCGWILWFWKKKYNMKLRHYILAFVVAPVFFIVGLTIGIFRGAGKPNTLMIPFEGQNIEFLYVGGNGIFLAKFREETMYCQYTFSSGQPKVGRYRIVGVGGGKRELIPIPDTTESPK